MKIAVIAVASKTGEKGGAERFYEGLVNALRISGVDTDLVNVISDESNFEAIEETLLRFYDLDMMNYDGVISTKAPAYLIRHPNHVCYLQHTMRVFYDMFDFEFPKPSQKLLKQREMIIKLDTAALQYPRTKKVFVIGNEVRNRLLKFNGIDSEVLYQATLNNNFRSGLYTNYIFMPGRLHRWKRVDLVIDAMKYITKPVTLKIAGTGEDEAQFKYLAKNDARIVFCGRISDQEMIDLYADAFVVPFVPIREDFGLITLEAFHSGKPVITCVDSGEPTYIVKDGVSGFICEPNPKAIAKKIEYLYDNLETARKMGENGRESIKHITWENVAKKLLNALGIGQKE
jgi:glycosyltransferase involved in cell wall biosynthesis